MCYLLYFNLYLISSGQGYDTAFGIRLGTEWGLTLQQRLAKRTTLEGIIQSSINRSETTITLLGEQHYPLLLRNVNVYGGAGLHKGWAGKAADYNDPFGLTLIGGAEIAIGKINLSWDFKPSINLVGGENPVYAHTGISVRYILDDRKLITLKKTEAEKGKSPKAKERRQRLNAKKLKPSRPTLTKNN
ncbi:MAG: hypothetical protein HC912_06105 [Saprospiraceae bacterium]|nr:hypothetical protein [Saprospiraceae bacterium]